MTKYKIFLRKVPSGSNSNKILYFRQPNFKLRKLMGCAFMIKDRFLLGVVAGLIGNITKTLIDEVSLRKKISQRSYRATAAGVWVNKKKEAFNAKGQILGAIYDLGFSMLGGIISAEFLSRRGRDHLLTKGTVFGITYGAFISAALSMAPENKINPKDAASNLSYVVANAMYGIVTMLTVAKLGDKSLFDSYRRQAQHPRNCINTKKAYPY